MLESAFYRFGTFVVCALALLIAVMTSPLLPPLAGSTSSQTSGQMRNDSDPLTMSVRHGFKSAADDSTVDSADFGREAENEKEQERFARSNGLVSFLIAPPLSTSLEHPAKHTKALGLMQSSPMLRCWVALIMSAKAETPINFGQIVRLEVLRRTIVDIVI